MNIIEALKMLELGGKIYRGEGCDTVSICRWKDDPWENFQKCPALLEIRDLVATDWKYSKKEQ